MVVPHIQEGDYPSFLEVMPTLPPTYALWQKLEHTWRNAYPAKYYIQRWVTLRYPADFRHFLEARDWRGDLNGLFEYAAKLAVSD